MAPVQIRSDIKNVITLTKMQVLCLDDKWPTDLMLSSLARARNVVMLCRRRDLFAEDGVRCEHSVTRFAVAARFEKNKWLFSSDGTRPRDLGDEEHYRTFQDVEEV